MDELIKQYSEAQKWRKEMFIAMIVMLVLMVIIFAAGFLISDLLPLFLIFSAVIGIIGVLINIMSARALKKAKKIISDFLLSHGKTEEEVNAVLNGTTGGSSEK